MSSNLHRASGCGLKFLLQNDNLLKELNYRLLAEIWKIPEPELIISVHGSGLHPELISDRVLFFTLANQKEIS